MAQALGAFGSAQHDVASSTAPKQFVGGVLRGNGWETPLNVGGINVHYSSTPSVSNTYSASTLTSG